MARRAREKAGGGGGGGGGGAFVREGPASGVVDFILPRDERFRRSAWIKKSPKKGEKKGDGRWGRAKRTRLFVVVVVVIVIAVA